jgi:hypothetical protein
MNKKEFHTILNLTQKQPWLVNKADPLHSLLYVECDNDEKRELILDLINRFRYLSPNEFQQLMNQFLNEILLINDIKDGVTQFVAMTADSSSDSGQHTLYNLKHALAEKGWMNYLDVNRYDHSYKLFNRKGSVHTQIVLIDEIIGSGRTAKGRVDALKKIYSDNGVNINIKVRSIAASSVGLDYLKSNDVDVACLIELKRGISDHFSGRELAEKIKLMLSLEANLSEDFRGRKMPSLGYGGTEMLYVRDGANTPNNVFPIFWWPFLIDKSQREVVLHRAMGDA